MTLALVENDQEILKSLPEDMREEFFCEERVDRRWLELAEERNRATAGDTDADTILVALPPALRDQVVMDTWY